MLHRWGGPVAAEGSCGRVAHLSVRPNQALQRTGSVCGFTLLSRFQPAVGLAGR